MDTTNNNICKRCGMSDKDYSEPKKKPCPECGYYMIRVQKPRYENEYRREAYQCTNDNCLVIMKIYTPRKEARNCQ